MFSEKYVILTCISSSKKSVIYHGLNTESQQDVIIKFLNKNLSTNQKITNKILELNEIKILRIIDHPNIIKVNDYFEDNEYIYIIYPYLKNSITLQDQINIYRKQFGKKTWTLCQTQCESVKILNLMSQICDAVEYLHNFYIVHRDIKPQNIIITEKIAIMIDFDLAAILDNVKYSIQSGIIGTVDFMAPEIWKQQKNISYLATDIYSFGVTMYVLFGLGRHPYAAKTIEDLEFKILNNKPKLSKCGIPKLDKIIMQMIDKNPVMRPSIKHIKYILSDILKDFI